ncbi:hypothetical protein niasHT_029004 [Heterodera trifolii]|uniref:FLYWCH-type domain-containing protein n=1 Tax=Heterodera trifolii TaxID=157864 RepID=A0ABD2KRZ2_9BILA
MYNYEPKSSNKLSETTAILNESSSEFGRLNIDESAVSDADISLSPSLIPSVNIEQIAPGGASSSSSSAATVEQFAPGASAVAALDEIRFLPNNNNNIIEFQGHTYLYDKRLSRRPHPSLPNSGERLYNCRREKCRKDAKGKCRAQIALYWDEDKIKRGPTAHKK